MHSFSPRFHLLWIFLAVTPAVAQQTTPAPPVPESTAPAPVITPVAPKAPAVSATPASGTKPTPPAASPATYTVQAGDNPWTIAKKHGIKLDELLKANSIKDPKNLKIGDVLKLPEGVASKTAPSPVVEKAAPATAPAAPPAGADWELYTVKQGDNPWKIAKALKVEHQKIVSLNEGVDFTKLAIGQQIKVPKKP